MYSPTQILSYYKNKKHHPNKPSNLRILWCHVMGLQETVYILTAGGTDLVTGRNVDDEE